MSAADRALAVSVGQVAEYMRQHKLSLDDLINIGGQDLVSPNKSRQAKARSVDNCWSLMAGLGVKFTDIEHSERVPQPIPA